MRNFFFIVGAVVVGMWVFLLTVCIVFTVLNIREEYTRLRGYNQGRWQALKTATLKNIEAFRR